MRTRSFLCALPIYVFLMKGDLRAQFGRGGIDWMTAGSDAQRSSWIRNDPKISLESMRKPGFQFLWKLKLNNEPVQLNSLSPAILLDFYIGYRGFRSLAFVGGSSNNVFAIDTDLARIEWQRRLPSAVSTGTATPACPGGMTANLARPTTSEFPMPGGRGGGRGGPAHSAVGSTGEGAVTIAAVAAIANLPPPPGRGARPVNPGPRPSYIDAITSDGMFHHMYVSNGLEPAPPLPFLPPNLNAPGLIVIEETAYVATDRNCGGPSGVWALDIPTGQVSTWRTESGIAGSVGPAFAPDGRIFVATNTGELVVLEPKTLKVKGSYSSDKQEFTSSPVLFEHRGKLLIALATKDGQIQLFDASDRPKVIAKIAGNGDNFAPGALASWVAPDGTRWLLAANRGIAAWKVVDQGAAPSLQSGWVSPDLVSPLTPAIINGVVFALASGEFQPNNPSLSVSQRLQRSSPAVLYAFDGITGKQLWNSGKTITSFVHGGGISGIGSQVYLGTYDGNLYTFGFPIEH
jgi:outer membrane protein assembly factor BamB